MSEQLNIQLPKGDVPNANNVIYSTDTLKSLVDDFNENKSPMMCTLYESDIEKTKKEPSKISHTVSELQINDGQMTATVTIHDTQAGESLRTMLDSDVCTFGVSTLSRMTGTEKYQIATNSVVNNIGVVKA